MLLTLFADPPSPVRIPAEVVAPQRGNRAKPYLRVDGKRITRRQQAARQWALAEATEPRQTVPDAITTSVAGITYPSFTAHVMGPDRHDACLDV